MSLEAFGTILGLVASLIGSLLGIIKLSEWLRNRGKQNRKRVETPEMSLEYNNDFRPNESGDVITYFLNVKNEGKIVAKDVEIRLYKVEQKSKVTNLEDRYILHRLDYVKAGDSYPFTFISDYLTRQGLPEHLRTPAGKDRIFPRENGVYTFLISSLNFPLITQQLIMSWNEKLGRYEIKKYENMIAH